MCQKILESLSNFPKTWLIFEKSWEATETTQKTITFNFEIFLTTITYSSFSRQGISRKDTDSLENNWCQDPWRVPSSDDRYSPPWGCIGKVRHLYITCKRVNCTYMFLKMSRQVLTSLYARTYIFHKKCYI